MATAPLHHDDLLPRPPATLGRGLALALLAHAGLVGALALALHWRLPVTTPVTAAELWAAVPQAAGPPPAPTPPPTPAPPRPAPAPAPTPRPPAPVPPPAPTMAEREAEIALQRRQQQQAREQQAREQQEAARQAARRAADEKAAAQAEAERQKALKAERAEKAQKAQEAERAKAAEQQRLAEQRQKAQDAQLAKAREENLKRMLGQASAAAGGTAGQAEQDAAPSPAYAGRIKARIKPNIVLTTEVPGNPVAEAEVRSAPDGTIIGRRISKSSGNAAWDETVLRAIDRTAMLPRDVDGRIPTTMILVFPRQE